MDRSDRILNQYFILTLAISIVLSVCILYSGFGELFLKELLCGLVLASVNGFVGNKMNRKAVYVYASKNPFWGLAIHFFRVSFLLILLLLCYVSSMQNFNPFLITTLTGYFCFLTYEVLDLHFTTLNRV